MNLKEALAILGISDVSAVDEAYNHWAMFYHPDNYSREDQHKAKHFLYIVQQAAETARRLGKRLENQKSKSCRICDHPHCREGRLILPGEAHMVYGNRCYHNACSAWETSIEKVGFDNVQSILQKTNSSNHPGTSQATDS